MSAPFRIADTTPGAQLSPRLATAMGFIGGDCVVLADIGTDHARLPIAAIRMNIVIRAIASDIAPGPLTHAVTNIFNARMNDRIITRLGDGFDPLEPNEADVAVLAGMGGMNIAAILERGEAKAKTCKRLILQPQKDTMKLRKSLHSLGYHITGERLAREGERFYVVLAAAPASASESPDPWTEREYSLGKHLPDDPQWKDYIQAEITRLTNYLAVGASGEKGAEYEARLAWLKEALHG